MKKASILIAVFGFTLITAAAYGQTLGAVLTGGQEFPGPGDPDGFGTATFTFNADRTQITVDSTFTGIGTAITGAHIHEAPAGVAAGVLVGFSGAATITNGRINTTVAIDPAVANRIIGNPSGFYFNVHTTAFGPGAIRGQLSSTSSTTFVGDMNGAREVPGPGHATATGSFSVSINDARTELTYRIATSGLGTITNSHIHNGVEGQAAGVFVGLSPGAGYVNGVAQGAVAIGADQASQIINNPAGFYVNVHTSDFPNGAIRGQLVVSSTSTGNTVFLPVIGRVSNATETFITDVRIFNPSFSNSATVMIEFFPAGGTTRIATLTIPARGTAVLDDIVGGQFGTTGIGGARVSSSSRVVASSRIFSDRRPTGGGTIGQFFPGVTQPLRRGILTQISHQTGSSGLRTNVGLFNQNDVTVTVRLELRDAQGGIVASNTLNLAPRSFRQDALPVYFPAVTTLADGTLTFDASSPIVAYASVVDNFTTDPLAVLPVEDTNFPTAP